MLAIGNLTAEEATALSREVSEAATPPKGLPAAQWPAERVIRLLPGGARAIPALLSRTACAAKLV